MKNIKRLEELCGILAVRGKKAEVSRITKISTRQLGRIAKRPEEASESTLTLLASALGLPADYFLDPQPEDKRPVRRRLVVELDLDPNFPLTEKNVILIRDAMLDAGKHIVKIIKNLDF